MPKSKKSSPAGLAIFEGKKIRRHWDDKKELWFFSVVDIVQVLTNQLDFVKARKYWNKLSERLRKEGSEVVTKCHRLKMQASDGKFYLTDAAAGGWLERVVKLPALRGKNWRQRPDARWSVGRDLS